MENMTKSANEKAEEPVGPSEVVSTTISPAKKLTGWRLFLTLPWCVLFLSFCFSLSFKCSRH